MPCRRFLILTASFYAALPDELLEMSFDDELSLFLGGGSGWPRA
jgi:hypothetical protein